MNEGFCQSSQLAYLQLPSATTSVGLPILWLHGWASFKEIWVPAMQAAAPHVPSFAPDLPGHGGSPLGQAAAMQAVVTRLLQFIEAQQLTRFQLVGHSMGGNIAAELTLQRPDLVERLVLVDPALLPADMPRYTRAYLQREAGWAALRGTMALARLVGRAAQIAPIQRFRLVKTTAHRVGRIGGHDPEGLHRLVRGLFHNHLEQRLDQIVCPTLVIGGLFDPLVPVWSIRRMAALIPNCTYLEYRFGSHNPMDERPEQFQQAVLQFFGLTVHSENSEGLP